MRMSRCIPFASLCGLATLACAEGSPQPLMLELPVLEARGESHNFVAPQSGREEVPAVDTKARGNAVFRLSPDGSELHYRLMVANIEDVTQAHIHIAPAGANGPPVVFLFGLEADGVTVNGILAEGTITEGDLIEQADIGFTATMGELIDAMRTGNAYVNTHTLEHGGGEVRGQVRAAGPSH